MRRGRFSVWLQKMTGFSSVWGLVGVNSKCGVQCKRKCKSHESCVCIVGFSACGCQKKSNLRFNPDLLELSSPSIKIMRDSSTAPKVTICLCLFVDGEIFLVYQHCNMRDVENTKLTEHRMTTALSASSSITRSLRF